MIVGIVLKLNREYEDLKTYVSLIRKDKVFNVPKDKAKSKPSYNHLVPGNWLLIYDPDKQAVTVVGKVMKQRHHTDNPDFPCFNHFDPANLYFPKRNIIPLAVLESVFKNFTTSRRYRNMTEDQFRRLVRRVNGIKL